MRLLWWGKYGNYGPDYPRNRTILNCLRELGHEIVEFHPRFSETAYLEAKFRQFGKIDAVWVPCFRQRDVNASAKWAKKNSIPLIFDPLISAYDKQVFERNKFPADSTKARKLLDWEKNIFSKADWLIADTECHKQFFAETFDYPIEQVRTIPVSAEEQLFFSRAQQQERSNSDIPEVLFFGTFISLQGATYIAESIQHYKGDPIRLCFLGEGPEKQACQTIVANHQNAKVDVTFESWIPIEELGDRIRQAAVCLGVFGIGKKAHRVIPNKVYQSLACNRPLVTLSCDAYSQELRQHQSSGIYWVKAGEPKEIAAAIENAVLERLETTANELPRKSYERFFSNHQVKQVLSELLSS